MSLSDLPNLHSELHRLACYLAGDFSNRAQAWENPPFYAHIQVCYRPLPWSVLNGFGFYVEQAYAGYLEDPYRVAVVKLEAEGSVIYIRNYRLLQSESWRGAARVQTQLLDQMTVADLVYLPGCDVIVHPHEDGFKGESEPGNQCCVVRKGQPSYLKTTVHLSATGFSSHDQGFDPDTHQQIWGSIAGPFQFYKLADFSPSLAIPPS